MQLSPGKDATRTKRHPTHRGRPTKSKKAGTQGRQRYEAEQVPGRHGRAKWTGRDGDGEMNAGCAARRQNDVPARRNERAPTTRAVSRTCALRAVRAVQSEYVRYLTYRTICCFECFEKGCEGSIEKVRKKGNKMKNEKLSFPRSEGRCPRMRVEYLSWTNTC